MYRIAWTVLALLMMPLTAARAADGDWGDLTGRICYDGDAPPPKRLGITRDASAFGKPLHDESLIVNAHNRGLANLIVYLLPGDDQELAIHPSYARTANAKVDLIMEQGRFEPHVLLLRTSQIMGQHNKDGVGYNAHIQFLRNTPM